MSEDKKAPLPQAWGVTYQGPNPDGSRKSCGGCMMWVRDEGGRCMIHPRDMRITQEFVCGYFVGGAPLDKWMDHPGGMVPLDKNTSGLGRVPGGTSCDLCVYYKPKDEKSGLCYAVAQGTQPPAGDVPTHVEALGCCARWEQKEEREVEPDKLAENLKKLVSVK